MVLDPRMVLGEFGAYCFKKYGRLSGCPAPIARLGEELKETHTCASTGEYTDRDLTPRLAAIDGLRPHWMDRDSDGVADLLAILLEEIGTNLVVRSEELNNAAWAKSGTPIVTDGSLTHGAATLSLVEDDDGAALERISQTIGFTADGTKSFRVRVKADTSTNATIQLFDSTAVVERFRTIITWAAGIPSLATATGSILAIAREANGVYELHCQAPGVIAANTNNLFLTPAGGATGFLTAPTGRTYFGCVHAENAVQCHSYKKTVAASVAGNRNILSFPLIVAPNKNLCIYHRHIERLAPNFTGFQRLWQIGKTDNTNPRLWVGRSSGTDSFTGQHITAAGSSITGADANPIFDDLTETRLIYTAATGKVSLGAAKSLGTETTPVEGSALTPGATWSDVVLSINGVGTASVGNQGWIATIVATWSVTPPSIDEFRAFLAPWT